MITQLKKIIDSSLRKIYPYIQRSYTKKIKGSKHNMFISYLAAPFYHRNDIKYLNHHQNRGETLIIGDILCELGISHKFVRLDKPLITYAGYDIVFGVEPNFIKACKANPNALKIYYATGAYCKYQNKAVRERTDQFNKSHNTSIPYYRLAAEHDAIEIADAIIQIGTKHTIATYPKYIQNKIIPIRQTCHTYDTNDYIKNKLENVSYSDFVWMGSAGSILKGLDLVLDYFISHPGLNLHIFGNIDFDVWDYYKQRVIQCKNIHFYGLCDLDSDTVRNVGLKCAYVILPSASEGCPGSVINMAKLGCIPIVTPISSFEGLESYGLIIPSYTSEGIDMAIQTAINWTKDEINSKIEGIFDFSNKNFCKKTFTEDFQTALSAIISKYENKSAD
ncbi:glycosyltransferase [Muribaculum intestinale]|uniref:Glycosyltransferase family 1 protein n=1 Tax=Muribaculum intestinale TaxID=1796646 RepID=A0A4S2FX22_9BACT|nr:glycosyltransferase [Muribaculum intestinale]MYM12649.1 glycosyltransferase family 1 protein [Muribaculum intestinale]TGY73822.1 glycosyltransferase family 1 protein [Muribaculum intestinale]